MPIQPPHIPGPPAGWLNQWLDGGQLFGPPALKTGFECHTCGGKHLVVCRCETCDAWNCKQCSIDTPDLIDRGHYTETKHHYTCRARRKCTR